MIIPPNLLSYTRAFPIVIMCDVLFVIVGLNFWLKRRRTASYTSSGKSLLHPKSKGSEHASRRGC